MYENGKPIYDGPEKRTSTVQVLSQGPTLFGISIRDWCVIASFLFTAGIISVYLQQTMRSTEYLLKFASNSDKYHSATSGLQFDQGMPVGGNLRVQNVTPRNIGGEAR